MDVNELLQKNEEELFLLIGEALPKIRGKKNLIERGKEWFKNNKNFLATLICPKYQTLKSKSLAEAAVEIAAIIGDAFTGIPALIIAVIILKTGLKSICE